MNAYFYQAAIYCEDCAESIIASCKTRNSLVWPQTMKADSNYYPQGPSYNGGGEADTPQHCDCCQTFLENPLTGDGYKYVQEALNKARNTARDKKGVLAEWRKFYSFEWDSWQRCYVSPEMAD